MVDLRSTRKTLLRVFILFLGLTAVIAIVSVLRDEFGPIQMKTLGTCFAISAASILSMCCAAFIERNRMTSLGMAGIILAVTAALLSVYGLWMEFKSPTFLRVIFTVIIAAVAMAHAFLLQLPRLDDRYAWVQAVSALIIGILAVLILAVVWWDVTDDWYNRLIAVVSILVGLVTVVIPILMKLSIGEGRGAERLVLVRCEDGTWRDKNGTRYRVEAE